MSYTGILIVTGIVVGLICLIAFAIYKPWFGIPALFVAAGVIAWFGRAVYVGLQT